MMSVQIQYRFNYYHERDIIEFKISANGEGFTLGLKYDDALSLMGSIVSIAQPFFSQIKKQIKAGVKEDVKAEFDETKWNEMMERKDGAGEGKSNS